MLLSKDNYTSRMQAFLIALAAAALTVILHTIGMENYWYWTHRWFDVITHLLGGFSLGMLASALLAETKKRIILTLAAVFPLVIGWEVFEVVFVGIKPGSIAYNIEAARDVVVGMLGAGIAAAVCTKNRSE